MKRLWLLAVGLLLVLIACGAPPAPADDPAVDESETAVESTSEEDAQESAETEEESTAEESDADESVVQSSGDNTVALATAATTIEEASEPRAGDWIKGADDPLLSIVEYGDFQ